MPSARHLLRLALAGECAEGVPNRRPAREYYNTLLDQLETEFEHIHHLLAEIFGSGGARILPMSDLDHFRHYKRFLNPSLNDRFDFDPPDGFVPELLIQENCWHSEGNGQNDFGFFLDGHYHSLIVLTRWPRTTYPGIIQRLTNLRLLNYTITVNVDPLPISQEISKEEKEHDSLAVPPRAQSATWRSAQAERTSVTNFPMAIRWQPPQVRRAESS